MNELDLSRLLNTARRGGEVSYERLSKACGGTPSAKRLHQLENGPLKNFPDPLTIQALAKGTGFSSTEIIMASARSLGLPVTSEDPDTLRIHGLSAAPSRVTDLLRDLGREIVKLTEKERDGNVSTAPITRAGESPAPGDETTQDDVDLAAYETGRESQGRRLRRLQDEAAEAAQE